MNLKITNASTKDFLTRSLDIWISIFLLIVKRKLKKPNLLNHNGESIFKYPENKWNLVPFPDQKGSPFNADNLATINKHSFLLNERFKSAQKSSESRWSDEKVKRDISWRLHTILWASELAINNFDKGNRGIFLECGTGKGYMAAGICDYLGFNDESPDFFLVDTFSPNLEISLDSNQNTAARFAYADGSEKVKKYFSKYKRVSILQGKIPEIIEQLPEGKIQLLHLDLNHAESEFAALQSLKDRFVKGTVIIFDDYGGPGGEKQSEIHEAFARQQNRNLLTLPTGQALLII